MTMSEITPAVFVGQDNVDTTPVIVSIHVRVECRAGRREHITTVPFEELPLLRLLYRAMGGKVKVLNGLEDKSYAKNVQQKLSEQEIQLRAERLQETYEHRTINQIEHNWFSDTYGAGANMNLAEKMYEIIKAFPKSQVENPRAEVIEALCDKIFPHTTDFKAGQPEIIAVPGLDQPIPELGSDAEEVPEEASVEEVLSEAAAPIGAGFEDEGGDPALINFLVTHEDNPMETEAAIKVADLVAIKPVDNFSGDDMKAIGMDMRSKGRIVSLVGKFYEQQAAAD